MPDSSFTSAFIAESIEILRTLSVEEVDAAVALLACQSGGFAESWLDRDGRTDLRRDGETQPSDSKASPSKDFTIGLTLPTHYSSNVASASVDSLIANRGDGHVAPEFYLKWSHQYDWAKLSAEYCVTGLGSG